MKRTFISTVINVFHAVLAVVAIALVTGLGYFGCTTREDETLRAAQASGCTAVSTGPLNFFECSEGDKTGRSFCGTYVNEQRVCGTVCCGILKGCTIRY